MSYVVITENDESKWDDQTGALYHFPARYKNKLKKGKKVIYYKGAMTDKSFLSKRLSIKPHYFGIAQIGNIFPDEDNKNQYFAEIEDFIPFLEAIEFKDNNNNYIEEVTRSNHWRDGVREITENTYIKIVELANFETKPTFNNGVEVIINDESLPNLEFVNPELAENIFKEKVINNKNEKINRKKDKEGHRYSNNAKKIGDRAEEVVLKYLKKENMSKIRWVASEGEKPGYDICCQNHEGVELYIEVKGTTTSMFDGFIITNNELQTSEKLGDRFYIYFVTNCLSRNPKIQIIKNPYNKIKSNDWVIVPVSYNVKI
ncbi:DUF3883 domain-containing protein [Lysinibacillus xylanilyticus]|uniref:DUF3883 domain-containing protein n=1 Tax=Lysinibacillus xylanilyticus TaxID=582475 RepID=UPI002B24B81C|nr:DUF3883 domain-containing protein [Lysinibacillus xylanilyticus]MEB2280073.1 DUF3883 domain-containing protein [Lysinibacillus xylanilyticus]